MGRTAKEVEAISETNRASWNLAIPAHNSHKRDQAAFLRNGGSTLFDEERRLLGDLSNRELLHLQCNCGQDTLSLASLGAKVTGVDISDSAIEFAQQLSTDSGIPGTFVRCDLYPWLRAAQAEATRYDRVFSSYGSICWLPDLDTWATGIQELLRPGGSFVLVEFHPLVWCLDECGRLKEAYFNSDEIPEEDGVQDYVALSGEGLVPSGFDAGVQNFKNPAPTIEFQWTTAQILTALISAGLRIEVFEEYPYTNGCRIWEQQQERPGARFGPPPGVPEFPQMFGLRASRPA